MYPQQSQFGSNFGGFSPADSLGATAPKMSKYLSFLRPTNSSGDPVMPSYTKYVNNPVSSYTNPLYTLFNDRRPAATPGSTLYKTPTPTTTAGGVP